MSRTFTAKPAQREQVPLLVGLMGPSGSGKSFSALRLASGIQRATGGEIVMIDTEARRGLHYAANFRYQHMQFDAPFGSLDYLAAIQEAARLANGGVIIVDSMSHEHEGPGGLIDLHEQELDRMAGQDWSKRERVKMLAWQKPKQHRRRLINGLLQINANFIFCFRAKETAKPVKNPQTGKNEVVPMGFVPIAGDELVFEMTVNALLLPGSRGVPTWQSENQGERMMMKLPQQFVDLFSGNAGQPLDEATGRALAEWARGDSSPAAAQPAAGSPSLPAAGNPSDDLVSAGREAAMQGMAAYQAWFASITKAERTALAASGDHDSNKTAAAAADKAADDFPGDRP